MFFQGRSEEVIREELALSDFNLEDHDYIDHSLMNIIMGKVYSRWIFHFILGLFFYFILGIFFPIFFLFIFIDFIYYLNDALIDEEFLSFEFYWYLYDYMVESSGADFNLTISTFYIYNELGYVIWGINSIEDYCEELYDFNIFDNQMGLIDRYVKLPKIKLKNKVKFNKYNIDNINNIININKRDSFFYTYKHVKNYFFFNRKIIKVLENNNIIKNNKSIKKDYYFYLFNEDKGLTWCKFVSLFK